MISLQEFLSYLKLAVPEWAGNTVYSKNDLVFVDTEIFVCLVDHTSDAFDFQIDIANWREETVFQQSVDSAIKFVQGILNRNISSGNVTETFNGLGGDIVYLKSPLSSVSTIKMYNEANNTFETIFTGSDTISNSVYFNGSEGWIKVVNGYGFTAGELYEIVYVGVEETDAYIKQQCLESAALFYYQSPHSNQDRLGRTSKNVGGQASAGESFNTIETFDSIRTNLYPYRTWNV